MLRLFVPEISFFLFVMYKCRYIITAHLQTEMSVHSCTGAFNKYLPSANKSSRTGGSTSFSQVYSVSVRDHSWVSVQLGVGYTLEHRHQDAARSFPTLWTLECTHSGPASVFLVQTCSG